MLPSNDLLRFRTQRRQAWFKAIDGAGFAFIKGVYRSRFKGIVQVSAHVLAAFVSAGECLLNDLIEWGNILK